MLVSRRPEDDVVAAASHVSSSCEIRVEERKKSQAEPLPKVLVFRCLGACVLTRGYAGAVTPSLVPRKVELRRFLLSALCVPWFSHPLEPHPFTTLSRD